MCRKAFTLVEMMIVTAIIGILMGVLSPVLKTAREQGRWAACMNNLKQIATATAYYRNDNGEWFPLVSSEDPAYPPGHPLRFTYWFGRLSTYMKKNQIFFCPSHLSAAYDMDNVSYGWNVDGLPENGAEKDTMPWKLWNPRNATNLSVRIVAADSAGTTTGANKLALLRWWYYLAPRHANMSNILFGDGSVRRMKPSDVEGGTWGPSTISPYPADDNFDRYWLFQPPSGGS